MELPNKTGEKDPTRHLLPQNETSSSKNWLHIFQFFAKYANRTPPKKIIQAIAKIIALYKLMVKPYC